MLQPRSEFLSSHISFHLGMVSTALMPLDQAPSRQALVGVPRPTTSRPSQSTSSLLRRDGSSLRCLAGPRNCRLRDAHTGCGCVLRSQFLCRCPRAADVGFSALLFSLDFFLRRGCNLAPLRARISCVLCPGVVRRVPPLSLLSSWAVRGPTCGPHVDLGASYLSRTLPVLSPSLDFFVSDVQGLASS